MKFHNDPVSIKYLNGFEISKIDPSEGIRLGFLKYEY